LPHSHEGKPMTLFHLMKTPTGCVMASDTAVLDDDGVVVAFQPKHAYFAEARLAFGITGRGTLPELATEMDRHWPGAGSVDDFLATIPKAARILRDKWRSETPRGELTRQADAEFTANDFAIFVAAVTETGPHLFGLSTCPRPDLDPALTTAYEIVEVDGFIQPAVDFSRLLPKGYWRGVRDCRPLVDAQRRCDFPLFGGAKGVGGDVFVTILSRTGVTHKKIRGWRDKIGKRIAE